MPVAIYYVFFGRSSVTFAHEIGNVRSWDAGMLDAKGKTIFASAKIISYFFPNLLQYFLARIIFLVLIIFHAVVCHQHRCSFYTFPLPCHLQWKITLHFIFFCPNLWLEHIVQWQWILLPLTYTHILTVKYSVTKLNANNYNFYIF